MYESNAAPVDPYSDAYNAPPPVAADTRSPRPRSRSRSPRRSPGFRSPRARSPPAPRRPSHAPAVRDTPGTAAPSSLTKQQAPTPTNVLGVFGLSIRTQERDLDDEFSRFGRVEKVTIVYDQRSGRSRGFGFIKMHTVEDSTKCIQELNGVELNGRRIRVDYSVTDRPHAPTPGEYMGHRRRDGRESYRSGGGGDSYRDSSYRDDRRRYDDRDRDFGRDRERDYGRDRDFGRDRDSQRERDPYGRDNRDGRDPRDARDTRDAREGGRDWRERRSPPPVRQGGSRYSPEPRRRRSYSRSPPRGASPPRASAREYEANGTSDARW